MTHFMELTARDLMSRKIETIESKASLREAAGQMTQLRIHCLIVPSSANRSIGIVTNKDIVQLLGDETPEVLDEIRVEDVMSCPAITLQEHLRISDCILLMRMSGIRSVPVMRAAELVGVLSFSDILFAVASPGADTVPEVS